MTRFDFKRKIIYKTLKTFIQFTHAFNIIFYGYNLYIFSRILINYTNLTFIVAGYKIVFRYCYMRVLFKLNSINRFNIFKT